MTIGDRIKNRRTELGLTADDVAARLGKSRATVYRYESGEIEKMPTTVLEPLAVVLNTTPAYLMGWEEEPQANKKSAPQLSETDAKGLEVFRKLSDKDKEMFLQLMADRLNSRQE